MNRTVFMAGDRAFRLRHLVTAAAFRYGLDPVQREIEDSLASLGYAEDNGLELDINELLATAAAFRRDHGLTTAEKTRVWLEARDLTLEEEAVLDRLGRQSAQRLGTHYGPVE